MSAIILPNDIWKHTLPYVEFHPRMAATSKAFNAEWGKRNVGLAENEKSRRQITESLILTHLNPELCRDVRRDRFGRPLITPWRNSLSHRERADVFFKKHIEARSGGKEFLAGLANGGSLYRKLVWLQEHANEGVVKSMVVTGLSLGIPALLCLVGGMRWEFGMGSMLLQGLRWREIVRLVDRSVDTIFEKHFVQQVE